MAINNSTIAATRVKQINIYYNYTLFTKIIAQHVRLKLRTFPSCPQRKNNDKPWNPDGKLFTHLLRI